MAASEEKKETPKKNDMIGKYKITKMLAKGGMGAVYKGIHPTLKQPVILKKLTLKGSPQFAERFKREARIMMNFNNDNIVDVYDHFKIGRSDYIVLEFVDGMSLEQLLQQERYLPNDLALYIFREAARALKYAHDKGVVHRDVKPANILISRHGEIKLVDFGIAASDDEEDQGLTQEGMTLGTPSYMSPEQIADSKGVDKRADIYSLGVMLYEMTTGKKPYPGSFTPEAIAKIQKGKYPPPRKYNPNISTPLIRLIKKMMKVKPNRRYQDLDKPLRIADGRLRRKNVRRIQQYLTACIRESKREPLSKPLSPRAKVLMVGLPLAVALLGIAGVGFMVSGLYYEVFQPRSYGALQVEIKVPPLFGSAEDLRLNAELYRIDGGEERHLANREITFRDRGKESHETGPLQMTTPKIYLPAGTYRLKMVCENQIFTDTLYLSSLYSQRQEDREETLQRLSFTKTMPQELPIELSWEFRDRVTGRDITDATRVSIHFNGKWHIFTPGLDKELRSGREMGFRLEARGYKTEELWLPVDPARTQLTLEASLSPLPGRVTLKNQTQDRQLKLLLEGDTFYRDAEKGETTLAPLIQDDEVTLHLFPGRYTLTAARSGKDFLEIPLDLQSGAEIRKILLWDEEDESLRVQDE